MAAVKNKNIEILLHVVALLIVFGSVLFFFEKNGNTYELNWHMVRRHGIVLLFFTLLFYLNYLWWIPKLYFNRKKTLYIVINVLFLLIVTFVISSLNEMQLVVMHHPPPAMDAAAAPDVRMHPHARKSFLPHSILFFFRDLMLLALGIALSMTVKLAIYANNMEKTNSELEKTNVEMALVNLRYQLNPHFLLNTLNNIYALIELDKDKAQQAVWELGKLLRYVLYGCDAPHVPLSDDIDFLKRYIKLMRMRIDEQNVTINTHFDVVPEYNTHIAPILFVSLVENAFKHGISATQPSLIDITIADTAEGQVTCCVRNSNFPKNCSDKSGSGIGLKQLQHRLDLLYPERYTWTINHSDDNRLYESTLVINTQS